ncbi:hypothetical protein Tco_1408387 [Tanacetum coccineum]
MSFAKIERIVTKRIANAIKAVAVYEAKIHMAHDSMDHVVHYRTDKNSDRHEVEAKDKIIASTWNLVDRSLTSAEFRSLSSIVPSTVDTKLVDKVPRHNHCDKKIVRIPLGDETLTIQSNMSDGYALIVTSEQRVELFDRIEILERDNIRLRGMLCVERQRVDRLRDSMSYA